MQLKCKRITSIVFGIVHSYRAVAGLLHNSLVPDLPLSVILSALSCTVCEQIWENLTLQHTSTIRSPLLSQLITFNFSSILTVLHKFFTWIALSDIDCRFMFLTHFGNKSQCCGRGNYTSRVISPT
jgi:hypothetical protein